MHILGTPVHIHTKYEVSMSNHVGRRAVQRQQHCQQLTDNDSDTDRDNEGQSMIV